MDAKKPAAASTPTCTPAVLQLDRRVSVQVSNEWVTAALFVAGCRDALVGISASERKDLAAVFTEVATRDPRGQMRSCEVLAAASNSETLATANKRLSRPMITDWCWDIVSIAGPV